MTHARGMNGRPLSGGFTLGRWLVRPNANLLVAGDGAGAHRRLEPRQMALLVALAKFPGQALGREDLLASVWRGRCVTEASLSVAVHQLRKSLGDDPKLPRYIQTLPGHGYKLVTEPSAPPVSPNFPTVAPAGPGGRRWRTWAAAAMLPVLVQAMAPSVIPGDAHQVAGYGTLAGGPVTVLPVLNLTGEHKWNRAAGGITERLRDDVTAPSPGRGPADGRLGGLVVEGSIHARDGGVMLVLQLLDRASWAVVWRKRTVLAAGLGNGRVDIDVGALSGEMLNAAFGGARRSGPVS